MRCAGIDLGTKYSVLAAAGAALPVISDPESPQFPTVVAFPPSGGALVGPEAEARLVGDPTHTLSGFRRLMGARWDSSACVEFAERTLHALVETERGGVAFDTRAGHVEPRSLTIAVLSSLVSHARLGPQQVRAVLAVPCGFDEAARRETLEAAREVGFREVWLVEEPLAVAEAYAQRGSRSSLGRSLVYSFGAGTFECAVVDEVGGEFQVVAHGGDAYLGGVELDRALARHVASDVRSRTGWDIACGPMAFQALVTACEAGKRALSRDTSTALALGELDLATPQEVVSYPLSRGVVRELSRPLVRRTLHEVDAVLERASLRPRDIQAVLLSGGSTWLPEVEAALTRHFGRPPRRDVNPAHAVAVGANLVGTSPSPRMDRVRPLA